MSQDQPRKDAVYFINLTDDPSKGYVPCIAVEGVKGYYRTDWNWGSDLELAQKCAKDLNEKMGYSEQDVMRIKLTTF